MKTVYSAEWYSAIRDGSSKSAAVVLPIVFELIHPNCVVDVGCGAGSWASVALQLGAKAVLGVDGDYVDPAQLAIPESCFVASDLRAPLKLGRRFDLAISVEVAEHLPANCAETFVQSLCELAPVVLFSAAVPGQGGNRHLNEQWPAYWAERFARQGFQAADCLRSRIWEDQRVEPWYRQNVILYADQDYLSCHAELNSLRTAGPPPALVHPAIFADRISTLTREATAPGMRRILTALPKALVTSVRRRLQGVASK
ncbi:MAG: methyltransferase domain-containing protein [Terriglobales bacterium]|jgi:SAM-dependent methyltransferase